MLGVLSKKYMSQVKDIIILPPAELLLTKLKEELIKPNGSLQAANIGCFSEQM